MTGADHLGEERAGEMRLAGAGSADQQQATAPIPHLVEPLGIVAAHGERLALRRRLRSVPGEGPVQETPRDTAAPDGPLEIRLGRSAPVDGKPDRLAPPTAARSSADGRALEPGDPVQAGLPRWCSPCRRVGVWFMVLAFRYAGLQDLQAFDEGRVPALAPLPGVAPVDDELVDLGLHPGPG